ncbi:MAG: CinA family protein [Pseudomonadota bacterium]
MAGSETNLTGEKLAAKVLEECRVKGWLLATAESCTGGMVVARLTDIAGSSAVVDRGYVTYSNEAKTEMLGVPSVLIGQHGAVSEPVARAMVKGALIKGRAHVAVSITGVAGPGGGTVAKPVGLVHFAAAKRDGPINHIRMEFGAVGRETVREASVTQALQMLLEEITRG